MITTYTHTQSSAQFRLFCTTLNRFGALAADSIHSVRFVVATMDYRPVVWHIEHREYSYGRKIVFLLCFKRILCNLPKVVIQSSPEGDRFI